jgi:hypothetical protein
VEEASKVWGARLAELTFGNNSRVNSEKARRLLGWKPMGVDLLSDIEQGSYAAVHGSARDGLVSAHKKLV